MKKIRILTSVLLLSFLSCFFLLSIVSAQEQLPETEDYLSYINTHSGVTYAWTDYKWCKQGDSKLESADENYFKRYFTAEKGSIKNSKVIIRKQIEDWKPTYRPENCRIEMGMEMCDYVQNGTYRDWKIVQEAFTSDADVIKYLASLNNGECVTIRNYAEREQCPEGGYACPFKVDNIIETNSPVGIRKYDEYAWWNSNYPYCQNITHTENHGKVRINETVRIWINSSNIAQNDGDDIRIVDAPCKQGGSEIPRSIVDGRSTANKNAVVYNVNCSASSTCVYSAYYGYADATAPVYDYYPVYFEDNFNDNNISDWVGGGLIAWNYATKCSVASGIVTCAGSQGMNTYFGKPGESEGINITNNHYTVKFKVAHTGGENYAGIGMNFDNETVKRGHMLEQEPTTDKYSSVQIKSAAQELRFGRWDGTCYKDGRYNNLTWEFYMNGSMGFLNESVPVAAYTDNTNTIMNGKGIYRVSFDSYGDSSMFDEIKVVSGKLYDNPLLVDTQSEETEGADPCTYSGSGIWNVNCYDNCSITTAVVGDGSNLNIFGEGTFQMSADVSNFNIIHIAGGCKATCQGGCFK